MNEHSSCIQNLWGDLGNREQLDLRLTKLCCKVVQTHLSEGMSLFAFFCLVMNTLHLLWPILLRMDVASKRDRKRERESVCVYVCE